MGAVLVIGELNVDLVLTGLSGPPRVGGEILTQDLRLVLGSASAIFACGIRRLGHRVGFVSKVGDDDFGRFCLGQLASRGISVSDVTLSTRPTGTTIVLSTQGDRALITHLGAITDLTSADLPEDLYAGFQHLHLTSYFLQSGLRPDFAQIIRQARAAGLSVSFDPNSDPDRLWSPAIWEVIEGASVLFLNDAEATGLAGCQDVEKAVAILSPRVPCLVVKLGAKGALAVRGQETCRVDGFSVPVADTTGAGDSFAAGFVHAMLSGHELNDCLRIANAVGALSATRVGGVAGQPDIAALKDFLLQQKGSMPPTAL